MGRELQIVGPKKEKEHLSNFLCWMQDAESRATQANRRVICICKMSVRGGKSGSLISFDLDVCALVSINLVEINQDY